MRVLVCKNRKTGETIDVLDMAIHKPGPDVFRTFDCTENEWTAEQMTDYAASKVPPVDLTDIGLPLLESELDKRGLDVVAKVVTPILEK